MIAVIFEVWPADDERREQYLDIAASLRADLVKIDGFISIERFQSLVKPEKLLSLSSGVTKKLSNSGATCPPIGLHRRKDAAVYLKTTVCASQACCGTMVSMNAKKLPTITGKFTPKKGREIRFSL